jgi:hypothetical protein
VCRHPPRLVHRVFSSTRRWLTVTDDDAGTAAAELLTLKEAAAVLRAPVATLRYWRHLGVGRTASVSVAVSSTGVRTWIAG